MSIEVSSSPEAEIAARNATPLKRDILSRLREGLTALTHGDRLASRAAEARRALNELKADLPSRITLEPHTAAPTADRAISRSHGRMRLLRSLAANGLLLGAGLLGAITDSHASSLEQELSGPRSLTNTLILDVPTVQIRNGEWMNGTADRFLPLSPENFTRSEFTARDATLEGPDNPLRGLELREVANGATFTELPRSMKEAQDIVSPDEVYAGFVIPELLEESAQQYAEANGLVGEGETVEINTEMPVVVRNATESQAKAPYRIRLEDIPEELRTVDGIASYLRDHNYDLPGDPDTMHWIAEQLIAHPDGFAFVWNGGSFARKGKDNVEEAVHQRSVNGLLEVGTLGLALEIDGQRAETPFANN
jgi:hypothetical protein